MNGYFRQGGLKKTAVMSAVIFCFLFACEAVFAQEDFEYEFLKIEAESEAESERDIHDEDLRNLHRQLEELEYYRSDLKAQESKALAALPANLKKKFNTSSEKAAYYKKLSKEYTDKLANDELSASDIKISQNLITLSELYTTEESIKAVKKELEKRSHIKK
ncbi:MAG: hypothetical protein FWH43_04120 [Endomicrobia bacterium]|nr:hypothetical protein [Endomicrobiia bacterium]